MARATGGIRSPEFPNWFVAQLDRTEVFDGKTYRSRPLVEGQRLDKRKYVDADRKAHRVVPVRFVQTCPNGHLSDIDWREFVHRGKTRCRATLWLDEAGAGNDFTEIFVRCSNPACMEKVGRRQLSEAKQTLKGGDDERPALGLPGPRPWLGPAMAKKPAITAREKVAATPTACWCVPLAMPISRADLSDFHSRANR